MTKHQNKIEKLITELCPKGVEYKILGNVCEQTSNIKWQNFVKQTFQYIDLTSVDRNTHSITQVQTIDSDSAPSRAQQIVKNGDIIFGTTRPTLKRFCLIRSKYDGQICSTGFSI